jgi:hypothetical protein
METVLFILLLYLIGVFIYTVVIRNDAMHKYSPHVKISDIVKEGLRDVGIGFLIGGVVIGILVFILSRVN